MFYIEYVQNMFLNTWHSCHLIKMKILSSEVLMARKMLTIIFWVDGMKSVYGYQCFKRTNHPTFKAVLHGNITQMTTINKM